MNLQLNIIKGSWSDEAGLLSGVSRLVVSKRPDGSFFDPDTGSTITAVEYRVTDNMTCVDITSEHAACRFVAQRAECERIGMPVRTL